MAAIEQPECAVDTALENPDVLDATADGHFAAASGNRVVVVDLRRNQVVARRTYAARLAHLALSEDGRRLAVIEAPCDETALRVCLVAGGEEWSLPLASTTDVAWEPAATGGALLLVGGNGPTPAPGRLTRLEAATGRVLNERPITRWKIHSHSLRVGPAGRLAAAENSYKDLEIFSLPDLAFIATDQSPAEEAVSTFLLDDRRDRLVVGRGDRVYDGPASRKENTLAGQLTSPSSAGTGDRVALAGATPPAGGTQVRHLNWLHDRRWLAAGDGLALVEGEKPSPLPLANATLILPLTGGRMLALLRSGRLEVRPELPATGPGQAVRPFFGGD